MARYKAVSTGGPSVRLLEPSWWEVNPRNTSVLGSERVFVDVDRQDEGKSAPCVFDSMWAFQPVRFRARLSWLSAPTPTSPVSLSFYLTLHHSFTLPYQYPPRIHLLSVLCARHRAAWHSLRASVDPGCHPSLLLSSFPSLLPSYPRNRETCAGLFMLFLWHFHPRSEVCSQRVGTGGEAGVADELKSTRLALKLAPDVAVRWWSWLAIKLCPLAGQASDYSSLADERWILETLVSWAGERVFVDVDRQDEGKSAPCAFDSMWAFQPVRFRARLSWLSAPTPTSPVSLSFYLTLHHSFTLP